MCFSGYKINGGDLSGLTLLQKKAILIIGNEQLKWASTNKAMPIINMG